MSIKKIIIILATGIVLAGLGYLFLHEEKNVPQSPTPLPTNNSPLPRPSGSTVAKPINPEASRLHDTENLLLHDIQTNLSNWQATKDLAYLEQAINQSTDPDNESVLEVWGFLIAAGPSGLANAFGQSLIEEGKAPIETGIFIFDWFIELSGDYGSLSSAKKQEILKAREQLNVYVNTRQ